MTKDEGFRSIMERVRREMEVRGKASYGVAKKLIMLKATIKNWANEKKEKEEEGTNKLLEELERLDNMEGNGESQERKGKGGRW